MNKIIDHEWVICLNFCDSEKKTPDIKMSNRNRPTNPTGITLVLRGNYQTVRNITQQMSSKGFWVSLDDGQEYWTPQSHTDQVNDQATATFIVTFSGAGFTTRRVIVDSQVDQTFTMQLYVSWPFRAPVNQGNVQIKKGENILVIQPYEN